MQSRLDELKLASAEASPANKKDASVEMVKIEVDDNADDAVAAFQGIMNGIQKIEKSIETINTLKQRFVFLFYVLSSCSVSCFRSITALLHSIPDCCVKSI